MDHIKRPEAKNQRTQWLSEILEKGLVPSCQYPLSHAGQLGPVHSGHLLQTPGAAPLVLTWISRKVEETQPMGSLLLSEVSHQPPYLPAHNKHTIRERLVGTWASDAVNTWTALSL